MALYTCQPAMAIAAHNLVAAALVLGACEHPHFLYSLKMLGSQHSGFCLMEKDREKRNLHCSEDEFHSFLEYYPNTDEEK